MGIRNLIICPIGPKTAENQAAIVVGSEVLHVKNLLRTCLDGHQVQTVGDGSTAIDAVETYEPDVMLLDIALPVIDGYTIAERLRDRAAAKKPFLIAITGHGTIGDRLRSAEAGIHLHLVKPVAPSMLAKVLERFQRAVSTV